jgi:uncharacterized membrane protein
VRSGEAGVIQAINVNRLVRWAHEHRARVVLEHAVGDFVPMGVTLMTIHGGADLEDAEHDLHGTVAFGDERTIQQDPAFAIRIMVDIALMALSPAVNAPTTATQVLGHLGETLRAIGATDLGEAARHGADRPVVIIQARSWEDFLSLGVTEIRVYGGTGIQVMRSLRATLEELRKDVLPEHRAAVDEELRRLDATVAACWSDSADLDRAKVADRQGIGGPGARPGKSPG